MSRICPITNDVVLYLECNECEDKEACRNGLLHLNTDNTDNKADAKPS